MIGQHKRNLATVPYQSDWKNLFAEEAGRLRGILGDFALCIEHVGSTSIPWMDAKPIIDIMVAVVSLDQAREFIPLVEGLGYEYKPHDTIPERLFFAKESSPEYRTHHLNLSQPDSGFWRNQIAFRDYLRTHESMAAEYVDLKKRIAERYAQSQELDRDAKTVFVRRVLELAEKEESESR